MEILLEPLLRSYLDLDGDPIWIARGRTLLFEEQGYGNGKDGEDGKGWAFLRTFATLFFGAD